MALDKFRVAVLDDFEKLADTVPAYEKLKARVEVTIFRERLDSSEKIQRALGEMDALLLMRERTYLSESEYMLLPKLKFISQTGRTSRHLDLPSATRRGIAVAGTPADNGASTKELTIGLILSLMRWIPHVDRRMRHESWPAVAGRLLEGKTAGVVGFGRIGKEVARLLNAFNARVLAFSRTLTQTAAAEVVSSADLGDFMASEGSRFYGKTMTSPIDNRGVQTIRQLLPPAIEAHASQPGPWEMNYVTIQDIPRFGWRGVMLDGRAISFRSLTSNV